MRSRKLEKAKKGPQMKLKLIALVALLAPSVQAATVFCAGSAASGSGDGSIWANRMAWADALAAAVAVEGDAERAAGEPGRLRQHALGLAHADARLHPLRPLAAREERLD